MSHPKIVWELENGTIAITTPAPRGRLSGENDGTWLNRVAAHCAANDPSLKGAKRLADRPGTDIPENRYFRGCWRNDGTGKVAVDLALARFQRIGEIRAERDGQLRETDQEMIRALENGVPSQQQALAARRQMLRDLPNSLQLETCATPEEVQVYVPIWP